MLLLKYFASVGTVLVGLLFAVSHVLGPARESPVFVRSAAPAPNHSLPKKGPPDRRLEALKVHAAAASDGEPPPLEELPVSPSTDVTAALGSTGSPAEFVPLPKPRPVDRKANTHLSTPQVPSTTKERRKIAVRPAVRREDVSRAYVALRIPSVPLPFSGFAAAEPAGGARRF